MEIYTGMNKITNSFKRYLLTKYTENKLKNCQKKLYKNLSWIQGKSLFNTINSHIKVLLNCLFSGMQEQSLRENKFIVDSIFKYTLERSENLIKSNHKTKDIKSYMQLNSYIVYDEITKGLEAGNSRQIIRFNIEKQLHGIQEKINSKVTMQEILENVITQ